MKGLSKKIDEDQFVIGDPNACRIAVPIFDRRHRSSFFGRGMGEQLKYDLKRSEGFRPPVDGNERKEAMLDLIPRARWPADSARP